MAHGDRQQVIAVVDDDRLVGAIWCEAFLRGNIEDLEDQPVREVMRRVNLLAYPGDSLHAALQRMIRASVEGLLVVEREHPEHLAGFISLGELARVLDFQINELAKRPGRAQAMSNDPLRFITVEEAMMKNFRSFKEDTPIPDVAELMASNGDHAAVVTKEDGGIAGIVTTTDLRRASVGGQDNAATAVGEITTRQVILARTGEFLANALAQPGAESARQIPVVADRRGILVPVGLLRRNDVLTAYLRGREQRAYTVTGHHNSEGDSEEEVIMTEAAVERDSQANGLTLRELGLPSGVVVTAIERDGQLLVPTGQTLLLAGDHVRLFGSRHALSVALALLDAPDVLRAPSGTGTGASPMTH